MALQKLNTMTSKKEDLVTKEKSKLVVLNQNKDSEENESVQNEKKYDKNIGKLYAQSQYGDSFLEVTKEGFDLKKNQSENIKIRFNAAKLNVKTKKQEQFASHFVDNIIFKGLVNMIQNGKIYELEREARNAKNTYMPSVWSEIKKPPVNKGEKEITNILSIIPGKNPGKWLVKIIERKEGEKKPLRDITVPVDEIAFFGLLKETYDQLLIYQINHSK